MRFEFCSLSAFSSLVLFSRWICKILWKFPICDRYATSKVRQRVDGSCIQQDFTIYTNSSKLKRLLWILNKHWTLTEYTQFSIVKITLESGLLYIPPKTAKSTHDLKRTPATNFRIHVSYT